MNKDDLRSILSTGYDPASWVQVLTEIFGVRELRQKPANIPLPKNDIAEAAWELGSFSTTDDRIVGLYQVDLNDRPRIWQNRVGLRSLLRNVYKHDVDAALVVFVQNDNWRLSFISEIRVLNNDGTIETWSTQPKRFTYLLGEEQKTNTATQRLYALVGERFPLGDIQKAFSVEALNKEFYSKVSKKFYELIGATEGKGKKQIKHERKLKLPSTPDNARTKYQEFAVRLIGRIVFCWFLKEKKSEAKRPLIPNGLIESGAVKKNYYHDVLEPLFFETLNTPMDSRRDGLPAGCAEIPFLNGGLFEPHLEDHYEINKQTGFSLHINTLVIPDDWFGEFFSMLEEYNFTIDENSPVEIEISVDPEMLGRIFENLLAEINPETGESARKATGSFYTPREIVNYMVDEALILYLKGKLQTETTGFQSLGNPQATFGGNDWKLDVQPDLEYPLGGNRWTGKNESLDSELRNLFSYSDEDNPFNEVECEILIRAIHGCKILDPACGSGAFPIGILQRLVYLLGKLDADNLKWKRWLKLKALEETGKAYDEGDSTQREERLLQISGAFEKESSDYGRKLFLIENCIYGVDIQPIAAEISKLRCFLTLIVDDTIHDDDPNRGVNPLPNLEFKFVTANSLLPLPEGGLFQSTTGDLLSRLSEVRHEYINSFGVKKATAKQHFKDIQDEIFDEQIKHNRENPDKRAIELSRWNPFSQEKVDWFDSSWMFGVSGFDVVIGNPPYISHDKVLNRAELKVHFESFEPFADIYCYFIENGIRQGKDNGVLSFITSNSYLRAEYGAPLREFVRGKSNLSQIINIHQSQVFENAIVNVAVLISEKLNSKRRTKHCLIVDAELTNLRKFHDFVQKNSFLSPQSDFDSKTWTLAKPELVAIRRKLEKGNSTLESLGTKIRLGLATGYNDAFIIDGEKRREFIREEKVNTAIIKPVLRGRDIFRFFYREPEQFILLTKNGVDVRREYPSIYDYLSSFGSNFKNRGAKGQHWSNLRACAFFDDFKKTKIIWIEMAGRFALCEDEIYLLNSAYFLLPPRGFDPKYLLAILNSKAIKFYLRQIAETSGMGASRWINNYVKEFPIPKPHAKQLSEIVTLVEEILDCKKKDVDSSTTSLESRLNRLVYRAYNLSKAEEQLIENNTL